MKRKPLPEINVTPLVDVLLVLVAILMVAMPMYVKRLPVELPATSLNATYLAKNNVKIVIDEAGQIFVDEKPVNPEILGSFLKEGSSIEIAAHRLTTYDALSQVVTQVQLSNPADISLITQ